ncbi:uncharacterized protein [Leptinotarsa decemlineata]|uniref:uncharacterized protein n=1 Tax=Leptinotarsa decemlineata TaxID=7539 RepID=UPI000C2544BA|nr:uncharacterized protein LOC111506502 [Leptinotarsa decemlineata]
MIFPRDDKEFRDLFGRSSVLYLGVKLATVFNETFDYYCLNCEQEENMAAVPQAAFAAKKIRQNEEKLKTFPRKTDPTNYSSLYMNSIWGQYNRYSVHNLKKIMDETLFIASFKNPLEKTAVIPVPEKPVFSTDIGPSIHFSAQTIYN